MPSISASGCRQAPYMGEGRRPRACSRIPTFSIRSYFAISTMNPPPRRHVTHEYSCVTGRWPGVNFAAQLDSLLASRNSWPDATCETFVNYFV
jgi:hypothetical protein